MEQASFTVSSWQEQPIDNLNENFPVNQASASYQLSGALSGTASVEYLMTYQGSSMADGLEAVAQVVGFLHFEGTYLGKKRHLYCLRKRDVYTGSFRLPR